MTDDLAHPALLNTWKHHAGWIRGRITAAAHAGADGIARLPAEMAVVGSRLMDLYVGAFAPAAIAECVFTELKARGLFEYEPLAKWLAERGAYEMTELPDRSKWTIRLGPATGRYLHLHPGRWAPHTMRVQANTLRSAVMAHAHARLTGRDARDLAVVNEARRLYLGLLPVRELTGDGGLGAVIAALAE
ncbi:hypothetical protein [Frigoriglobus tundricola]|uniref:Uncharacterized protein n=1 Tax=Frigoriglobus tundricola TaxID=2774151 RepID=A0A6M5Z583_9BACT|nr:hypothetical protein [Frigoriglobus tundricola]QJX00702.1 hypothetical protein FTUN_8334 [Frigoriglobus tundricola]